MSANTETMTPEEIRVRGLEALSRELGPAGLIRFYNSSKSAGATTPRNVIRCLQVVR